MRKAHYSSIGRLIRIFSRPSFWFILALLVLITLPHYEEALQQPAFLTQALSSLGLRRHAFERILYLIPIVWGGFVFGWRGAAITSLAALVCMLPRAIFISANPTDAIFEASGVFIIGNLLAISANAVHKERKHRVQLQVAERELRFYLHQITNAQEEERKRISRELHDETIQALVVLSRQLDARASSNEGLLEDNRLGLEELRQQTNNIIEGVRRLGQDLRPPALDRLGLLPTLEGLAADVTKYSGIVIKVNILGSQRRFPEEVELVLFRITQEALRNVWRHSQATRAEITINFDDTKTGITISDNGKGFKFPETIGDLAKEGKLGLAGMQERARLIGGTLAVQSQPDRGTSVTIDIPI